jgi:alpha-glucosidase
MKTLLVFVLCLITLASARWPRADDHDHDHDHEMDWWEHGVFYQIYPRSFMDSNDDGVGDLKGIMSKLPHLKELGITGTWLSPIFKSPFKDGGYDIQDFYTVDDRFGNNDDLKALFAEAKKQGIKMILDFVRNFCEYVKIKFIVM